MAREGGRHTPQEHGPGTDLSCDIRVQLFPWRMLVQMLPCEYEECDDNLPSATSPYVAKVRLT